MPTNSVSARFQELFPETNLISLLTKYGGDAGDIFETIQDRYDAHEQEPLVGLLGIKAANIDAFARAAYWDLVSDIRVRYLSFLPRSEAAAIAAAAGNLISHRGTTQITGAKLYTMTDAKGQGKSVEELFPCPFFTGAETGQ